MIESNFKSTTDISYDLINENLCDFKEFDTINIYRKTLKLEKRGLTLGNFRDFSRTLKMINPCVQQMSEDCDYTDVLFGKKIISNFSTSSIDLNIQNEVFFEFLKKETDTFIRILYYTDFEDGIVPEISDRVNQYLEQNRLITYNWFNYLYSNYQDNTIVIAGLLRIIGQIDISNEVDCLLPLVECGLNHKDSTAQEAAIMVIEKWRTKNCLKALKNTSFSSDWMKKYALEVIRELENELQ